MAGLRAGYKRIVMDDFVATIRLRERRGSAIGICESPPLIELGSSAKSVFERMKVRLQAMISASDASAQRILVIRDDGQVEAELLR